VEGCCEHGNEPSGSIKCWEILDWWLLKRGSVSWGYVLSESHKLDRVHADTCRADCNAHSLQNSFRIAGDGGRAECAGQLQDKTNFLMLRRLPPEQLGPTCTSRPCLMWRHTLVYVPYEGLCRWSGAHRRFGGWLHQLINYSSVPRRHFNGVCYIEMWTR
jgi:hypothetical protein